MLIVDLCKECGITVPRKNYVRHLLTHTEEKFRCHICDKHESLEKLKISQERHFGGDAVVGNRLHKGYDSIKNGDFTLTDCFDKHPKLRDNMNRLWKNLATVDTFLAKRRPTPEECEAAATECEKWCELYPVFFPHENLTRKMVEWSLVLPRFIRERRGLINLILRLEQEGEHLHQLFNTKERSLKSVYNKQYRYFYMLQEYENKVYCTK